MIMKLKRGDILEFNGYEKYAAEKGAKAIFKGTKIQHGIEYIQIEWIRDGKDHGQGDGGYYASQFTKLKEFSGGKQVRIFEENKKVMNIDFKAGKERVVQRLITFIENFEHDMLQDIKIIVNREDTVLGNDTREIECIVEAIRINQKYTQQAIDRLANANSLFEILSAMGNTVFEEDEATILQAFLGVDHVSID